MDRITMTKFLPFTTLFILFVSFSAGCGKADTSAVATGVDDSVVQSEEQMQAMSAEYESQSQSK
jgi:hypothetical protein